jgi:hypothetical protein
MSTHCDSSLDLITSANRGRDGKKSAVRWFAKVAALADGSVAAHSRPNGTVGVARVQRSQLQYTRPCDCEKEHLLLERGAIEPQYRVRVIRVIFDPFAECLSTPQQRCKSGNSGAAALGQFLTRALHHRTNLFDHLVGAGDGRAGK